MLSVKKEHMVRKEVVTTDLYTEAKLNIAIGCVGEVMAMAKQRFYITDLDPVYNGLKQVLVKVQRGVTD